MAKYKVTLDVTEPMLGTAPSNPQIYTEFIATQRFSKEKKAATTPEEKAAVLQKEQELTKEELAMLPREADKGVTVFRQGTDGVILVDYMIRGFLKEAAASLGDSFGKTWGLSQKIDRWVFVTDATGKPIRQLPITRDGKQLLQHDEMYERPLRAMTMQGPRTTLACSEQINAPCQIEFHLVVLPLAEGPKHKLNEETISSWFGYGIYCGLGQFRNGSYGRFDATVTLV